MIEPRSMSRKDFIRKLETETLLSASKPVPIAAKEAGKRNSALTNSRVLEGRWDEMSRVTIPAYAK